MRVRLVVAAVLATMAFAEAGLAKDKLVVLSPHRKTIQEEYVPLFQRYYKETFGTDVEVEWVDQGGTSNAVKYLKAKAASNPKDVGVDVFWGGTSANFVDMADDGLLSPYKLTGVTRTALPKDAGGVQLSDSKDLWHATCVSSFGIMFNKQVLALEKLPEPKSWTDLADARYLNSLSITDPRQSGTNSTMNMIVMEARGYDAGWDLLSRIAGNTRRFTQSSSDPVRAVAVGDAAAAMAIDFYGLSQVWELGEDKIGFILPEGETVLDPDPVALVKGGGNVQTAQRFVDFLLTPAAQKIWLLPKGAPGGPTRSHLARLSVSPKAYAETDGKRLYHLNPFTRKGFMKFDLEKAGALRDPFNDLVGTTLVDNHSDLVKAWKRIVKDGLKPEAVKAFGAPFVSEADLKAAAKRWSDGVYRNETIAQWSKAARERYHRLASGSAH